MQKVQSTMILCIQYKNSIYINFFQTIVHYSTMIGDYASSSPAMMFILHIVTMASEIIAPLIISG